VRVADLDRDDALEARDAEGAAQVDRGHSARRELVEQFVPADTSGELSHAEPVRECGQEFLDCCGRRAAEQAAAHGGRRDIDAYLMTAKVW
jgi:hypothetical protein